jgi:fumarylacetoacetate (FAA) hydrolase family protein
MQLPSGSILLWYGAIVNIPAGFVLCDGNNSTPDLRDKFVPGAGNTYDPGDTGGSVTHTHPFTSDGHSHTIPPGAVLQAGGTYVANTDSKTDSGTTNNGSSLPPYHALAYIMKT